MDPAFEAVYWEAVAAFKLAWVRLLDDLAIDLISTFDEDSLKRSRRLIPSAGVKTLRFEEEMLFFE
jgi:hypothetical protein